MKISGLLLSLFALAACDDEPSSQNDADPDADRDAQIDADPDADADEPVLHITGITFTEAESTTVASQDGHLAFPDVTRLPSGELLIVYREGAAHVDTSGRIMMQRGSADGLTWSAPEVLHDTAGIDDRDPSVAVLPDGEVFVTYFQYRVASVAGSSLSFHQIFALSSGDDGATFGNEELVSPGAMEAEGAHLDGGIWVDGEGLPLIVEACSSPARVIDGRIIVGSYGGHPLNLSDLPNAPRSRITLFSRNLDGDAWSGAMVEEDHSPDVWLQEPSLLRLRSGALMLHLRTADGDSPSSPGPMVQARSDDGGESWSAWAPFDFVGHAPYLMQLDNGVLISAFREINDEFTREWVSFVHSVDGGETWSSPERIAECGASECGYPSVLELDGDRVLMVYYAAGGTSIEAVIYDFELELAD